MAKRKNPLKDLDAFLKQEATSIVKPEQKSKPQVSSTPPQQEKPATSSEIISAIKNLANEGPENYRHELLQIIRSSLEALDHTSAEDKMLINTILFLKDRNNWRKNVKEYWQQHQ